MNELYREILVKPKASGSDTMKKMGVIALTAVLAVAGILFNPLFLLGAVAAGVLCWFVVTGLDLEYEYLYVNGDFDIDRIMHKQRRKRAASYNLEEMEIVAPSASHDLDAFKNKGKVIDYTSRDPQVKTYTAVYIQNGETLLVKLELDEEIIKDLRRLAPRKISRDISPGLR